MEHNIGHFHKLYNEKIENHSTQRQTHLVNEQFKKESCQVMAYDGLECCS